MKSWRSLFGSWLVAVGSFAMLSPAYAESTSENVSKLGSRETGQQRERFYLRPGVTYLGVSSDSDEVVLKGLSQVSDLALDEGPIEGSGVELESTARPSVLVGYILPWGDGDSWSVETVIAPPFTIDISLTGTIRDESIAPDALGGAKTGIPALGETLGSTEALPAVFTLVYSFNDGDSKFVPYVGAGLTYVYTYDGEVTNSVVTEIKTPELSIDKSIGFILQTGFNAQLWDKWALNADLKYGPGVSIEGRVKGIEVDVPNLPNFPNAKIDEAQLSLSLDAIVLSVGAEYRF